MEPSKIASPEIALVYIVCHPPLCKPGLVHMVVVDLYNSWSSWLRIVSVTFATFYWLKQVTSPNQIHQVGVPSFYDNYCKVTLYRIYIYIYRGQWTTVGSFCPSFSIILVYKIEMIIVHCGLWIVKIIWNCVERLGCYLALQKYYKFVIIISFIFIPTT